MVTPERLRVVVVGTESKLGQAVAALYEAGGGLVRRIDLEPASRIFLAIDEGPVDLVIFADGFVGNGQRASELKRGDFAAGLSRLTIAPFQLANQFRSSVSASGSAMVLLTRSSAGMTHPDSVGRYIERPFRAAVHALWRCFSVEWQSLSITCLAIAVDEPAEVGGLVETIEAARITPRLCQLLDARGTRLDW